MLNTLKSVLAVTAFWTLGGFVTALCLELATRSSDGLGTVRFGVVTMTSNARPTRIRHDDKLKE